MKRAIGRAGVSGRRAGRLRIRVAAGLLLMGGSTGAGSQMAAGSLPDRDPDWTEAHRQGPLSAAETRGFLERLFRFVQEHHLKTRTGSPQRGMVYEYLDWSRRGEFDQFVQGEALDTMHDGAWLAAALVNAHRATGEERYREFLARWQLPFYCRMLNESDRLFSTRDRHARPGVAPWGREWALQGGEKGFVPYYWDDGGSVSLEMRRDRVALPYRPALDLFVQRGEPNPRYLLNGYSLGSSNHLAQDLGVMLQQSWLLFREGTTEPDRALTTELAQAARHLHTCRMNHHGHIPMCDSPTGLANGDLEEIQRLPNPGSVTLWEPSNHAVRALVQYRSGERVAFPGFADDQQYRYYFGIARAGGKLPRPLAFKTLYDAYTEPLLYRYYADDGEPPPGINRFDLHPYYAQEGRPADYRSDRKGTAGLPRPVGSRFGPQNMICCGWALQALRADPGLWEARFRERFAKDHRVLIEDAPIPGGPESAPTPPLRLGPLELQVRSTRRALLLTGACDEPEVTFRVRSGPEGTGPGAEFFLKRDGNTAAQNDRGQALLHSATVVPENPGFRFELSVPYGAVKQQAGWATPLDHHRWSLQAGDEVRNLYLAAPTRQVEAWLERELGAGLRTWEAVFRAKGYIPTGMGTGLFWDRYSDAGGYAHLISAAAQWLLVLEGKRDWELHRVPALVRE